MSEDKIYPSMVIRSQAEAIELLEQENKQLKDKLEFYSGLELDKTIDKTRLEYNKLQQENKQLKNDNAVMKAGLIQASNKQLNLYKEVIEEVREYMKKNRTRYIYQDNLGEDWWFEDLDVYSELLQILDKAKCSDD